MIKTALYFVIFSALFLFTNTSYAFDFAGLNGRVDNTEGNIKDIDWPAEFVSEIEVTQASIIRYLSQYDSWIFDRTMEGSMRQYEDGKEGQPKVFYGNDLIIPKSNKCGDSDSTRHAAPGVFLDRSKMLKTQKNGKEIVQYFEYTASLIGGGWNCQGKSGIDYWVDTDNLFTGEPISKDQSKENIGANSAYIIDYMGRTRNLKHDVLDIGEDTNALIDLGTAKLAGYKKPALKFVMDNCDCIGKEEEEKK